MSIAIILHVLGVVVWVGGMFFAWMVLRPAAALLEGPDRLRLWNQVFAIFFSWVWLSIIFILASGYYMIFMVMGGMAESGLYIHIMQGLGLVMMMIFIYLYFAPYKHFKKFVAGQDFPSAATQLATIRRIVGTNLMIGLLTIMLSLGGRYGLY